VRIAFDRDCVQRDAAKAITDLQARFESLTSRERDVVALVTLGKMIKQVAVEMNVSEVTLS
jgi:FixJ family two-component response regulator